MTSTPTSRRGCAGRRTVGAADAVTEKRLKAARLLGDSLIAERMPSRDWGVAESAANAAAGATTPDASYARHSGRVWIQVDAGDGDQDCGEIAEASYTVEGSDILLTVGKSLPTLHALLGRDPKKKKSR